jgi:hypothetical protein
VQSAPNPGETTYAAAYSPKHSRVTTFFRALLAIPHYVVLGLYAFAAAFAVTIAWLAIIVTGRYPAALYAFNAGFQRYSARVSAYTYLLTDEYPPFGAGQGTSYPVELQIGPPKPSYSRLSALLRFLPLIVVGMIRFALAFVASIVLFVAWIAILITGRLPQGLHNTLVFVASYGARASAYAYLLSESFPSFDGAPKNVAVPPAAAAGV